MATFKSEYRQCAICGTVVTVTLSGETRLLGAPDLDGREEEEVNTMQYILQECPHCGYVYPNISIRTDVVDLIRSGRYRKCDGIRFSSEVAARFYKAYQIMQSQKKMDVAFACILMAAWVCDDMGDIDEAVICRKKAIRLANHLIQVKADDWEEIRLVKADLMRRAGLFDQVIREYWDFLFKGYWSKDEKAMIRFALKKARARDSGRYRESDVFPRRFYDDRSPEYFIV